MLVIVLPLSGRPLSMPVMGITATVVGITAAVVGLTAPVVGIIAAMLGLTAAVVGLTAAVGITAVMVGIAALVVGTAGMMLLPTSAAALHLNRRHCVLSCAAVWSKQEVGQRLWRWLCLVFRNRWEEQELRKARALHRHGFGGCGRLGC